MKETWNITVEEYDASEEKDDDALVFEVGDMLAAVSLATYPIPNGEAELNAENNYMWEDAVQVAREHRAHIMVAVLGKEEKVLEKGKLFTKLVAACCRLASYVLACDVMLQDGETIGFTADDKHTITRSPGVGLPEEQMTLKISWEPLDGNPDDNDDPDGEGAQG